MKKTHINIWIKTSIFKNIYKIRITNNIKKYIKNNIKSTNNKIYIYNNIKSLYKKLITNHIKPNITKTYKNI